MKIYGCWICYNNHQTIKHSIESVLQHVDGIIVVDGSFDGKVSDDGTWEMVEAICNKTDKPTWHVKSKANTLYDKHNEHVAITGNNDPDVFTWQVDSDEIYLPEHAKAIAKKIRSNKYNGIAVKLINVNYINEGIAYTDNSLTKLDTYQMRIYRMHKGLIFKTKDNIFEHIVYNNDAPVQSQNNKIHYIPWKEQCVFNYHCLEPMHETIARYKHYKIKDYEAFARKVRSVKNNPNQLARHPMESIIFRA